MDIKIDPARIGGRASVTIRLKSGENIAVSFTHSRDDDQTIGEEKNALKQKAKAALEHAISGWED